MACGLGVCEGKETRRGPEKRDLSIGSTAEESGRWVSRSSGSRLEGKGGLQRSRRANLGGVWGMLMSDRQEKGRAALQVAMELHTPVFCGSQLLLPPAQPPPRFAGCRVSRAHRLPPRHVRHISGGRFPRCCGSGCRGCSQGCSRAAGARRDARVPQGCSCAARPPGVPDSTTAVLSQHDHRPHAATAAWCEEPSPVSPALFNS